MKPICYAETNTYKYFYINIWVPCLPTGRHRTIKIKIKL
jgi:hypothetical protein